MRNLKPCWASGVNEELGKPAQVYGLDLRFRVYLTTVALGTRIWKLIFFGL